MSDAPITVAVCNSSDDVVEMLCLALSLSGYRAVGMHIADIKRGEADFVAFVEREDPRVFVWDISPPYDKNWTFLQLMRTTSSMAGRGVVVTTTHKPNLDRLARTDTQAIEIMGKPYDISLVCEAVERACSAGMSQRS